MLRTPKNTCCFFWDSQDDVNQGYNLDWCNRPSDNGFDKNLARFLKALTDVSTSANRLCDLLFSIWLGGQASKKKCISAFT